ncbi:MAG: hypothetical protein P4L54_06510 [Acidocella sp.]|nr:hypothetical protein [Acidocella sp.]
MKRIILALVSLLVCQLAQAAPAQLATLQLGHGLTMNYYISPAPAAPTGIIIAVHGYKRDANRTFDATQAAASAAHQTSLVLVAPIFAVAADESTKCQYAGVPAAQASNAVWRCPTWLDGDAAQNGAITSFSAMDALVAALHKQFPTVRVITVAGFSAGGQFVQHYVGFAAPPPGGVKLRYVAADPGSWLYFDNYRPEPGSAICPGYNDWKLGLANLPPDLTRSPAAARAAYIKADVQYLEGALDDSSGPGTFYKLLAKKCGDELQGPYRLQRGQLYEAYDNKMLAKGAHHLTVVPGCAHDIACVFESPAAQAALFGGKS